MDTANPNAILVTLGDDLAQRSQWSTRITARVGRSRSSTIRRATAAFEAMNFGTTPPATVSSKNYSAAALQTMPISGSNWILDLIPSSEEALSTFALAHPLSLFHSILKLLKRNRLKKLFYKPCLHPFHHHYLSLPKSKWRLSHHLKSSQSAKHKCRQFLKERSL
jgi:hypothetical protein